MPAEPAAQALGPRGTDEEPARYLTRLEQASLLRMLDNLLTFPWIRARVGRGALRLHAAYFDVATGRLEIGDPRDGSFAPL
jgi:carbonic anhydrase